jgi:hypothetical protein
MKAVAIVVLDGENTKFMQNLCGKILGKYLLRRLCRRWILKEVLPEAGLWH